MFPTIRTLGVATVCVLAWVPMGVGCAAADTDSSAPTRSARTVAAKDVDLRFDGSGTTVDLTNSGAALMDVSLSTYGGGRVRVGEGRTSGHSALLPSYWGSESPRPAVIVVRPTTSVDPTQPGSSGFTFGASFDIDWTSSRSGTDNGDNLIQRGRYDDVGQYKLQVDNGYVSCLVRGSTGVVFIKATRKVDRTRWHRARCTRDGDTVGLTLVSYLQSGTRSSSWKRSGPIGAVTFGTSPMSIGGKVDAKGNVSVKDSDQFNGKIDNAFYRLN